LAGYYDIAVLRVYQKCLLIKTLENISCINLFTTVIIKLNKK